MSHEEIAILNDICLYLRAFCKGMGIDEKDLPPLPRRMKSRKNKMSQEEWEAELRIAKGIGEHDWNLPFKSVNFPEEPESLIKEKKPE